MAESTHKRWVLALMAVMFIHCSNQLQTSQYEALWRIKNQFNFPPELSNWSDNADFCNTVPNPSLTLVCYENNITQLHIAGNNLKLSQDFSVSYLFSNLANLPNLKVLSLVSLGLWGPLPSTIGALSFLEIINVSSNLINGRIPKEISNLKSLQTLILDYNNFTGDVPDWVGSLPVLSVLSLKNNMFSGLLPNTLSALKSLRTLVLSSNLFSGDVPNLQNLTNLQVIDLENNTFGPHLPVLPSKLVSLVLKRNNFTSVELDKLSSFYLLQKIDVSLNEFLGPFPQSFLSLSSLTYLDVSGNKLTGRLSKNMSCNEMLTFVNLSTNRLTGELPSCLTPEYRNITVLYNGNCLSKRYTGQDPESYCHNEAALAVRVVPHNHEKKTHGKAVIVSSIVAGIIGGLAILALVFVIIKKEYGKKKEDKVPHTRLIVEKVPPVLTLKLLKDASYISETRKIGNLGLPTYRTFVLDEIKEATDNFAASNLIGEGTRGQVYKGWLSDGTIAAIRCLKMRKKRAVQSYTRQLELVAKLRHRNLVSAIGHCFECCKDESNVNKILLVLEYVPNGTLRSYISEDRAGQKFSWTQRLTAVIGIAKGIQFLHTGTVPIFSNDLKITDVLLDHDYHVKISKFNLPLLAETVTEVKSGASVSGSKRKSALRKKYEEKNDVYDFGVILLEVLVGRTINSQSDIDASKNIVLSSISSPDEVFQRVVVDPSILRECSNASLKTAVDLCFKCLSEVPPDRPSIEDVIWNLQFAAQVQDSWKRDGYSNQGSPAHLS